LLTEISECAIAGREIEIDQINKDLEQRRGAWRERIRVGIDGSKKIHTALGKRARLTHDVHGEIFEVSLESFWQPHHFAAEMLVRELQQTLVGKKGERIFDLYGGVGLFTAFVSTMVGDEGEVILVESDKSSIKDAQRKFASRKSVRVIESDVKKFLSGQSHVDRVVLDPPRTGAGTLVIKELIRLLPKQILYISCDPATLARDAKELVAAGYTIESLRILDLFPNTEHVESVANFIIDR
jgi:tRNA/tmRNA/rRNA uracil-C5-methylase (TrmA/RlmC/RlmD family)